MPALFIKNETGPNRSTTSAARRCIAAGSLTSTTNGVALLPISFAAATRATWLRSTMQTIRPMPASRRAAARPMPLAAPVTTAIFPSESALIGLDVSWRSRSHMDPHRFRLGVLAHCLKALVAPGAALLIAAPGLGHVAMVKAIDPDNPGLEIATGADRRVEILCPDAGGETIDRVIGLGDCIVDIIEGNDSAHRAEDF